MLKRIAAAVFAAGALGLLGGAATHSAAPAHQAAASDQMHFHS